MLNRLKELFENIIYSKRIPVPKQLSPQAFEEPDDELSGEAVSCVLDALTAARGDSNVKMLLLPPHWRVVNTLFTLDYQVCNGGFHQFFTNTRGAFDEILIDDVSRLGDSEFIDIVSAAFHDYEKIDYQDQWDNLGKSWEFFVAPNREGRFKEQNNAYYAVRPRMTEQIGGYVRRNSKLFLDGQNAAQQ